VTTLIAGLRTAGITVPRGFDGAISGERFRNYVEQMLAPTLSRGDVLTLDNLSSHKAAGIETVIQARGAKLLYLPPYNPDRNPIKQPFAKPACPRQVHGSGRPSTLHCYRSQRRQLIQLPHVLP
jgi:transposase